MSIQTIPRAALPVEEIDALLAQHPFGNAEYITDQLHTCYIRRIGKLAVHLPIARNLHDALATAEPHTRYRIIGDTVFRCAVQHAHVQVETGAAYGLPLDRCEEVFEAAIRHIDEGKDGILGSHLVDRLSPSPRHGWVWNEGCPDTVASRSFRQIVADNYELQLCTPTPDELATLTGAADLLSDILPHLSRSVFSHTHLIAVFQQVGPLGATLSSSEYRISGTIFLNRRLLTNTWKAAEHLFHEALHQQLYDIRQSHSLLGPNIARPDKPLMQSPWNMPDAARDNYWDIHRSLAAFHVYVHLALLANAAQTVSEERGDDASRYGPITMVGERTALARAHYLGEQIRQVGWTELGSAGRRLVDWFDSVLELLDPAPPVQGSYVHLLLDRYWREANALEGFASDSGVDRSALEARLSSLLGEEVGTARSVLAMVDGDIGLFDEALASAWDDEPTTQFASVRMVIADTLANACPRDYELSASRVPDRTVKEMVESSSETLRTLLGR